MDSLFKRLFKQKGFSLVELSVVMAIVGLIALGSIGLYTEQRVNTVQKGNDAKLQVVKKALLEFTRVNKHLPCPDSTGTGIDDRVAAVGTVPAIAFQAAVPGVPATGSNPAIPPIAQVNGQAAIPNIGINVCRVDRGNVPYTAIGLSQADVQDRNGNFFLYAVDQGVRVASDMLNCPTDTACFFNADSEPALPAGNVLPGSVLPAFDLSTGPLTAVDAGSNLRICSDLACANVESNGLVAVLVALNENPQNGVGAGEVANLAVGTLNYFNIPYSNDALNFYDDQLLGIAAHELMSSSDDDVFSAEIVDTRIGPITLRANQLQGMGTLGVGAVGTNIGTDTGILDARSRTFDFGAEAANKQIVLTFDTHAAGGWNQPGTTHSGVWSDRGSVAANGSEVIDFRYDHLVDKTAAKGFIGYEEVTFVSAINGRYSDIYNADGSWDSQWLTKGQMVTTYVPVWEDSFEFIVTADSQGKVNLDFAVQTTATVETIDFENVELIFYDIPPPVPDFPSVTPIPEIPGTSGLL